ncbi:glycerol 3-phosphate dehydrogenase-like isoform X2 [Glandiceps talaboti]
METYDAVIIVGGVVGCAVVHDLTKQGYKCVLCEKNPDLVAEASSGNSGMAHIGFDAKQELHLLQVASDLNEITYKMCNIKFKKTDALVVAWNQLELDKLPSVVEQSHKVGVHDVYQISKEELRRRQPSLSHDALGAVVIPREMIVDSWLMPIILAHVAMQHGAQIYKNCKVTSGYRTNANDWLLMTTMGPIRAKVVINCAGLHGDTVEDINQSSPFKIQPRKGQFAVFEQCAEEVLSSIILPLPSKKTKGVLVFPTVYGHIVVGPTAEDQDSREDRTTNLDTIETLVDYARKVVPALKDKKVIATYAGLRPATQFNDYHLITHKNRSWITVGGIRSTGVSTSLAIAKHVADEMINTFQISPEKKHTQDSESQKSEVKGQVRSTAVSFRVLPNGYIDMGGHLYKITHPLSRLGLMAKHKL